MIYGPKGITTNTDTVNYHNNGEITTKSGDMLYGSQGIVTISGNTAFSSNGMVTKSGDVFFYRNHTYTRSGDMLYGPAGVATVGNASDADVIDLITRGDLG